MAHRTTNSFPLVSVILPVYNGQAFLREAINSILSQTYSNYELIIINDGSIDRSASIVEQFHDTRIRFYGQNNMGLSATLNRAIDIANGIYIARQDQDDFSYPSRFEKQVNFLETHPNCGMVGTWAEIWKEKKKTRMTFKHPSDNLMLKFELLFNNPFVHSSMMIRKKVFTKVGKYSTDHHRQPPEDYELWSRVSKAYEIANIPEILHVYREMPCSMSRTGVNPFLRRIINLSAENISYTLGKTSPCQDIYDLAALSHGAYDMLSAAPDLSKLSSIIRRSARCLIESSAGINTSLDKNVAMQLNKIRCRYLLYWNDKCNRWFKTILKHKESIK